MILAADRALRRANTLASLICAVGALLLATPAGAKAAPAWAPAKSVDPITGVIREGLVYLDGQDGFAVVCTYEKAAGTRKRFWVAVKTGQPLGRKSTKNLTYRVGDDDPTTSRWDYTPREAVPGWPLEDRHLVERIIDRKAEKIGFRLFLYDNRTYDFVVPIDAPARELMAQTIAMCRS